MRASISWLANRNEFSKGIARVRDPARCRPCRGISGPKHKIAKTIPCKVEWIPARSTNYGSGKPAIPQASDEVEVGHSLLKNLDELMLEQKVKR
jgi:hypothetical protein